MSSVEKATKRVLLPLSTRAILTSSLGGFAFGYDMCVLVVARAFITEDLSLTTSQAELIVSLLMVGAAFSSIAAGPVVNRFGPNATIRMSCALFIVSSIILAMAPSYGFILLGRIFVGLAIGLSGSSASLYATEMSETSKRGAMVSLYELMICLGGTGSILISGIFTHVEHGWRYMMGLTAVAPFFQMTLLCFMPESPQWVFERYGKQEAVKILHRIHPSPRGEEDESRSESLFEEYIVDNSEKDDSSIESGEPVVREGIHISQVLKAMVWWPAPESKKQVDATREQSLQLVNGERRSEPSPLQALSVYDSQGSTVTRSDVKRLYIAIGVALAQIFTGCSAVYHYSGTLLSPNELSDTPLLAEAATTVAKFAGVLLSMILTDRAFGRRVLLEIGTASLFVTLVGFAVFFSRIPDDVQHYTTTQQLVIDVLTIVYVFAWALSWAPLMWVVITEVLPVKIRSAGVGITLFIFWIASTATHSTLLTLFDAVGKSWTFGIYAIFSALSLLFVHVLVPETRGKTFAEIDAEFN